MSNPYQPHDPQGAAGQPQPGQPHTGQPVHPIPGAESHGSGAAPASAMGATPEQPHGQPQPAQGQPYGQPVQGQQAYGEPVAGGHTAQPHGSWTPPAGPVTPEKKSSILPKILGSILAIGLLIGGSMLITHLKGGDEMPRAEQCITLKDTGKDDIDWKKVSCDDDSKGVPMYVATIGQGEPSCPNGDYLEYTLGGKDGKAAERYACLIPSLRKDVCYDVDPDLPVSAACTAPEADFKVVEVLEGTNDENKCSTEANGYFSFDTPARVICLTDPQ